jgi:hypothetical protein
MGMLVILWDANIFPRDNVDEEIIHLASAHRLSDVTALRERGRSGVGSQGKKKRGREGGREGRRVTRRVLRRSSSENFHARRDNSKMKISQALVRKRETEGEGEIITFANTIGASQLTICSTKCGRMR